MKIKLKDIFNSTVYITPNLPGKDTIRYRFKITQLLIYFIVFSILLMTFTITVLSFTPLKHFVFHYENAQLQKQAKKTVELEKKIFYLTKQLETISSTNKKLQYAYILGTSDSIDTTDAIYDSLKHESVKNLPYGGNILSVFKEIFEKFFLNQVADKGIFIKPSNGLIINNFNPSEGHLGIDFAVSPGSAVYAARGGLVIFADYTIDDGKKIIIQHDDGYITVYKHCSSLIKKERDEVVEGELIALSGNSGKNTTGPHLHFEIWKDGKPINPEEYFIK